MRYRAPFILLLFSAVLFAGAARAAADERAAPYLSEAVSNAPGAITVAWIHQGEGVLGFIVQLKTGGTWQDMQPLNHTYSRQTITGLQPDTLYGVRVCAVYGSGSEERECSEAEVSVRTMAAERSSRTGQPPTIVRHEATPNSITIHWTSSGEYGSFNVRWSEVGQPDRQDHIDSSRANGSHRVGSLLPGRAYEFIIQGCNWTLFGSSCSNWSRRVEVRTALPPLATPGLTQAPDENPRRIVLQFENVDPTWLTDLTLSRNGQTVFSARGATGYVPRYTDTVPRANTAYTYKVCTSNGAEVACSGELMATGRLIPPTAPLDVTLRKYQVPAGGTGSGITRDSARIAGEVVTLSWQHAPAARFIPGQFITIERQDRMAAGPNGRIESVWREVKRISAAGDPTRESVDVERELGVQEGKTYRVCAVVPVLGAAGSVCSQPATLP